MKSNIFRFNWVNVVNTLKESDKIIEYFKNVIVLQNPNWILKNRDVVNKIVHGKDKDSFLLNLTDLILNDVNATSTEIFVYLDLASRRSFFTFLNSKGKVKYLPAYYVHDYNLEKLTLNRLLKVEDDKVFFFYEEDPDLYDKLEITNG